MKKILAALLVSFFCTATLSAQVTAKPGLRTGANFSKFSHTDFDFKTDFYLGGFMAIKLSSFYTLQPEVNYSRQGAKADLVYYNGANDEIWMVSRDISVDYLSFTLINRFNYYNFDIHGGTTLDFETYSNVPTNTELDLGVTLGIGYTLPIGLTIEARWKRGLLDVLESDDYNNTLNYVGDNNANNTFQVGLSYSFDVKGSQK